MLRAKFHQTNCSMCYHVLPCPQSTMLKTTLPLQAAKTCKTAIYSHTNITELERTGGASAGAAVIG